MNTPTINQLKAAVAQFDEAFKFMESSLDQALEEARDRHLNIGCAVKLVGDQATRDRLDFEEGVALEDMMSFESALRDWLRIAGEVHHWLPSISNDIDDAAGDALSFDDYKSNEAMHRDLQAKHRRQNIRPMTMNEMDYIRSMDLQTYATFELGLLKKGPSRVVDGVVEYPFELNGMAILAPEH